MSLRVLMWILSIIIVVVGIFFLLKDDGNSQTNSRAAGIISMILAFFTFTVQWLIPVQVVDIPIKDLLAAPPNINTSISDEETVSTPSTDQEPESTLAITGFQMTGDAVWGRVYVKFHVTSNYDLLDGTITIFPGEGEDPIRVSYHVYGTECQSTVSNPNFAISFPAIESGKTYSAAMDASDISGNSITEEISFTVE